MSLFGRARHHIFPSILFSSPSSYLVMPSTGKSKGSSRRVNAPYVQRNGPDGVGSSKAVAQSLGPKDLDAARDEAERNRAIVNNLLGPRHKEILSDIHRDTHDDEEMGDFGVGADIEELPATPDDIASLGNVADAVMEVIYDQRVTRLQPGWRARTTQLHENWGNIDDLATAFLQWKNSSSMSPTTPDGTGAPQPPLLEFDMELIDLFSLERKLHVNLPDNKTIVPHLIAQGYLPTTPIKPLVAISLRTLDFYKILRQRKPSFSVESFTKVLCDLYKHPYQRRWRRVFADSFELYLTITCAVEKRIHTALDRCSEHWRVLNACPACMYELEGEPTLRYRLEISMDGNDSQKRIKDKGMAGDVREYVSDYMIPMPEVDVWSAELTESQPDEEEPTATDDSIVDDSTVDDTVKECVKNWKAAQSDSRKKAAGIFDETGWFASACRHGILLWVTDMVQSGEQALSILGPRIAIGYDIGCKFASTIKNSVLGLRFAESNSRCLVNTYHGYAHNYQCQTQNHPNNIEGVGLEDFETMEHFFSGSNAAAGLLWHATKFRRRLYLDLYLKQADADKYLQIGKMLLGNYKQAQKIICEEGIMLNEALQAEGITTADLDQWQSEQREYFDSNLGKEPEKDLHRIAYVELLIEYTQAREKSLSKGLAFCNNIPEDYDINQNSASETYESALSKTCQLETQRRRAREKVKELDGELIEMELRLHIEKRWDATTPAYRETVQQINQRQYRQALEDIQKLVVQRLFELHRLNLSNIGYKARVTLAKAMRTRSRAIQTTINKYNRTVVALGRSDTLDFARAAQYNFIEEFELLKHSHADLTNVRWKEPRIREAMKRHQRIKRAHEEIERLHVEILRVYSAIEAERNHFKSTLLKLKESQDPIYVVVDEFCRRRSRANQAVMLKLYEIVNLPTYRGPKLRYGRRKGEPEGDAEAMEIDSEASRDSLENSEEELEGADDDTEAQLSGIVDFISNLAIF
ncbi:hypothetical protein H1R20_g7813, partial [Candolleomyces eurysporus]